VPSSKPLPPDVLAIFGPTASGKSDVAEELARRIPAELVSADAMQVYRGLPVLTNQPEFPTRLVGILDVGEEGSVAGYQRLAHAAIDEILAGGRRPIVVGGTGLYLRAALAELALPPPAAPGERERLERLYDQVGGEQAHALLAARDPAAAGAVHANDRLELPKEELQRRIEIRTRRMFERGVEDEVRRALAGPVSATARTAFGLSEIAELPREQAIEALILRTRRYAAYQRKWMRRIPGLVPVRADRPPAEVAEEILGSLARA